MTIAYPQTNNNKGFTLIELLVVIAIIGVLAAVVLLAINPAELLRRSRDSSRLSDMSTLRKGIDATVVEQNGAVALPCTAVCASNDARGRSAAGTGWLGVAAGTFDMTKYISTLPVDPVNGSCTATTGVATGLGVATASQTCIYQFMSETGGTYEIRTRLESTQNGVKAFNDGGDDADYFEIGTNSGLALL
jgi:prepilin-type N-terminal cleavage/methylation domain-containing protein